MHTEPPICVVDYDHGASDRTPAKPKTSDRLWAIGGYGGPLTGLVVAAHQPCLNHRLEGRVSVVEARDYVLWPKHIYGNPALRDELLALEAGALVKLEVDGVTGVWVKMADGKGGLPTPGLKALGAAREHWHELFRSSRGAVVPIAKAATSLRTPHLA